MTKRPGMMIYFDYRECIEALSDVEAGKLFKSLLNYAHTGEVPALDGALKLLWLALKPKLDHDALRYEQLCRQKKYAVYCREQERKELSKLSYEEWLEYHPISDDDECYPATTTTATTTASTTVTSSAAATVTPTEPTTPDAPKKPGHHGVNKTILLTDADFIELMDEFGLSNLMETMRIAEPKAAALGYDAAALDWKRFLRKCWYGEVRQKLLSEGGFC